MFDCLQVSKEEGEFIAYKWGCPFFEISSTSNIQVTEVFFSIIRKIRVYENCNNFDKKKSSKFIGRLSKIFSRLLRLS
jgi:hypothetical protein